MKTAIILVDNIKQIVFTPENETEKRALAMFSADDNIELLIKSGTIGDQYNRPFTANVDMCEGGYLRIFGDDESRIFVLKPKTKK